MRKTLMGMTLAAAVAVLLTGCGSDSGSKDRKGGAAHSGAEVPASKSPSPEAKSKSGVHEVTLEAGGKGRTNIMYNAASQGFEEQKLPWTLTETVELTAAEQRVGYLVSVVPGTVTAADGTLQMGPCVIKVDGKKVTDNAEGKTEKGCTYKIKG